MATADVFLAFGADTGQLEASLARAQAEVKRTTAEMRNLAGEMARTGASADSEMGSRLSSLGSKLSEAKEHVSGFKEELKGTEGEGFLGGMVEKVKGFLAPLNSAKLGLAEMAEMVAAAFAVEKIYEFIRGMGEMAEQTQRAAMIMGTSVQQIAVLNYQFAVAGVDADAASMAINRFQLGLAKAQDGTGPVAEGLKALGLSAQELIRLKPEEQLAKIADAVSKFADTPTKTAAVEALGRGFLQLLPQLNEGSEALNRSAEAAERAGVVMSGPLVQALTVMDDKFDDLGQSIKGDAITAFAPFVEVVNAAVEGVRFLTQAFQDNAREGGIVAQTIFLIADALRLMEEGIAIVVRAMILMADAGKAMFQPILDGFRALGSTIGGFWADLRAGDVTFSRMRAAASEAATAMNKNMASNFDQIKADLHGLGTEFQNVFNTIVNSSKDAGERMRDALHTGETPEAGGAKPVTPELPTSAADRARLEIENLTEKLQANTDALEGKKGLSYSLSEGDRDRIIRTIYGEAGNQGAEGQQAVADVIRNRAVSGKYGSSIAEVTKASQFSAWGDSRTLPGMEALSKDSAAYKSIGEQVDKVFSGAVSDITKGASNYYAPGGMPGGRAPSWAAGTEAQNLVVIGGHRFSGKTEGLPAEPTGEPPTGAAREALLEKQKEITAELEKARQKLLDINTEAAGGTETARLTVEQAQKEAVAKQDTLTKAKELKKAADDDLAAAEKAGVTQERINKLKKDAADAAVKVRDAEEKQAESALKLEATQARAKGDTEAQKRAELELAELKRKAAGDDVAGQNAAAAEKIAIEKRYADQAKSLAMQKASQEVEAAHTAASNKVKEIDLEFRAKQISESQKLALTKAAWAEELATVKAVLEEELKLEGLTAAERQKIMAELQAAEVKYAQGVKEAQIKAVGEIDKAYKSMADKIAGTINSQIDGILEGTTTIKQAFANMAKSMTEEAIHFAVKWAAEHAAAAMANMAMTNATNAAQIAGNAAVAASQTASGAAGIASQAANAVQSIAIDGAKTFGGVFGFLAPLLGPFAAGPAAGAQATVLAASAAFDTGAWSLPRDMIAAVHQGEMVIPSRGGVADGFRNFMSDGGFNRYGTAGVGAPAGGNKSVSVNPAVHFNVSAPDGASVSQFFHNNHKAILSAVDRAVRHGSALGLRSFTR